MENVEKHESEEMQLLVTIPFGSWGDGWEGTGLTSSDLDAAFCNQVFRSLESEFFTVAVTVSLGIGYGISITAKGFDSEDEATDAEGEALELIENLPSIFEMTTEEIRQLL